MWTRRIYSLLESLKCGAILLSRSSVLGRDWMAELRDFYLNGYSKVGARHGLHFSPLTIVMFVSWKRVPLVRMTNADLLRTHGNIGSHVHFEASDDSQK